MVSILEFRPRDKWAEPRRSAANTRTGGKSPAQIIIFPGVRIERKPADDGGGDSPKPLIGRARSPAQGKK